jgi:CheY-like chemotaxis protein
MHMPVVLIADDDPVSLRFLTVALAQLHCEVVAVGDGAGALAAVQVQPFDLLLLDRCMPDLGGAELLAALRASGIATPAIATSAEVDAVITVQLRGAGFVDIIEKPATLARLEQSLCPYLHLLTIPQIAIGTTPATRLLDDDAALAAIGGDAEALHALRGLLAQELATLLAESTNPASGACSSTWRENLHRLRASCGFCGATALAESTARLDRGLRDDPENVQSLLGGFLHLCRATKAALCNQEPASADGARASESMPQARKPTPSR